MKKRILYHRNRTLGATAFLLMALSLSSYAAFSSGSTGADGALNITAAGVTVFNPRAMGLDPDSDNVFQFTTINIASGATLKLSADIMGTRPVIFLATGNVTLTGNINLNGENGHAYNLVHKPSIAGAGGYSGGIGTQPGVTSATSGEGPGAGIVGTGAGGGSGNPCGYGAPAGNRLVGTLGACTGSCCPQVGKAYGNKYLLPLVGGSGGSGVSFEQNASISGAGGGAGGGAILIASSGTILLNSGSSITAYGGGSGTVFSVSAGGGSGGSIRLVANAVGGNGMIYVNGGSNAGAGYIRVESYSTTLPFGNMQPFGVLATPGLPLYPAPGSLPAVKIVSIDGIAVPSNPSGGYTVPDVTINRGDSCDIVIAANNIPVGTIVHLSMNSEDEGNFSLNSTPLTGSLGTSSATARTKIPPGYSRFNLNATW